MRTVQENKVIDKISISVIIFPKLRKQTLVSVGLINHKLKKKNQLSYQKNSLK